MKLSELSYREYLAIEFLPAFMRHSSALGNSEEQIADGTVRYAFLYADAFLRAVGKQHNAVAHAEARASAAETRFEVLQSIHVNMGEDFAARVALTEIWELLGVKDQTAAVTNLRALLKMEIGHD